MLYFRVVTVLQSTEHKKGQHFFKYSQQHLRLLLFRNWSIWKHYAKFFPIKVRYTLNVQNQKSTEKLDCKTKKYLKNGRRNQKVH